MTSGSSADTTRQSEGLSFVIVNYNGVSSLPDMLESIKSYPIEREEIIVVDDGSTDESVDWLQAHHPDVRVVALGRNSGCVGHVRNRGLQAARGRYVFLSDNDIELLPDCLHRLLEVVNSSPEVFCATPRLVYRERRDMIFQSGNRLHFLGLSTGTRRGELITESTDDEMFDNCGGGIMLLDRAIAERIGYFDEGYLHAWGDDGELHTRGALYGYRCLHVPQALATHRAKEHGHSRAFGQIHNRLRLMFTLYRFRTLLLTAPSLMLFEIGLALASVPGGFAGSYFGAIREAWRGRKDILSMRAEMQSRRQVEDSEILQSGKFELPGGIAGGRLVTLLLAVLRMIFDTNWRVVRWFDHKSRERFERQSQAID